MTLTVALRPCKARGRLSLKATGGHRDLPRTVRSVRFLGVRKAALRDGTSGAQTQDGQLGDRSRTSAPSESCFHGRT